MKENVYRRLAEHLDQLPGGFAPSETGADLRLLQRLFTVEQAELATHLTLEREDAQTIAGRVGLSGEEVEQQLNKMSANGLIFSTQPEHGQNLYQAVPWVVGIYEFQVNNLSQGLLDDLEAYWSSTKARPRPKTISQMRTIPIEESIEPHLEALPYERVNDLIKDHDTFAVAPCICRRRARLSGGGCDAPEESCLIFGEWCRKFWSRRMLPTSSCSRQIQRISMQSAAAAAAVAVFSVVSNSSLNLPKLLRVRLYPNSILSFAMVVGIALKGARCRPSKKTVTSST